MIYGTNGTCCAGSGAVLACILLVLTIAGPSMQAQGQSLRASHVRSLLTASFADGEIVSEGYDFLGLIQRRSMKDKDTCVEACSGTLISTNKVLTAASCCYSGKTKYEVSDGRTRVLFGAYKLITDKFEDISAERVGELRTVTATIVPPAYRGAVGDPYDVCVMTLDKDITSIKPAALVGVGKKPQVGDQFIALGWGKQQIANHEQVQSLSRTLKKVAKCSGVAAKSFASGQDTSVCYDASDSANDSGSCLGDSGGPLLVGAAVQGVDTYGTDSIASGKCSGNEVYVNVGAPEINAFIAAAIK